MDGLFIPSYVRWWCKDMMPWAVAGTLGHEAASMRTDNMW